MTTPSKEHGSSPDRNNHVKHKVSGAQKRPLPANISRVLGEGYLIALGSSSALETAEVTYTISALPPNSTVAIGFAAESEESGYVLVSPFTDLSLKRWSALWRGQRAKQEYSASMKPGNDVFTVYDSSDPEKWLTKEGEIYELNLSAMQEASNNTGGKQPDHHVPQIVLIGIDMGDVVSKADSRPDRKQIVDHGTFTSKDMRVNRIELKTPAGKYLLDCGDAKVEPGIGHRYELSHLPLGVVLSIGFGVQSTDPLVLEAIDRQERAPKANAVGDRVPVLNELYGQCGVRRIHIHLQTKDGHVLISEEVDVEKAFHGPALPFYKNRPKGVNAFVTAPHANTWSFRPNTASGTSFVAKEGTSYVLEITIIDIVRANGRSLRLVLRS